MATAPSFTVRPAMNARIPIDVAREHPDWVLSTRQMDVFRLRGEGIATFEISKRLGLSKKTIESHYTAINGRLGLDGPARLIAVAAKWVEKNKETEHEGH